MRALKIAGTAIAAVAAVIALLLVIGIPSGFLTSQIQERVERETGYKLTVNGGTKIGLWPSLNVTLNDVTLQDPKERDINNRLAASSIQADVTLSSVWAGRPQITELVIVRPVVNVPLQRERVKEPSPTSRPAAAGTGDSFSVEHVSITGGTVVFSNLRDRVENKIETVNADVTVDGDRKIRVSGNARSGGNPLKFEIKATAPAPPIERQNIPTELKLDAPGLFQTPLSAKAEVRLNGSVVMINGLTGTLGDGAFNGWASVDLASKPLVKLDLDFQRLTVAMAHSQTGSAAQPWSNATIDLNGMNYVDAQARISAAELSIGDARFAPAAIDATLASGVLKAQISNLGAYDGNANGELTIDASAANPAFALRTDLTGVRALPLLRSLADFDKLDGKMQAKISVRSSGNSQRAIIADLSGTVFAVFQDGAIKGLNVAQMIRSLTASPLSGWQESKEQATDLTQLSASFQDRQGSGADHRSQSGRPAGQDDRRRHHRSQHPADRIPGRAETRDDHRRPGPRRRSGRARHSRHDRRAVDRAAHLSGHAGHPRQSRRRLCQAEGNGQRPVRRQWGRAQWIERAWRIDRRAGRSRWPKRRQAKRSTRRPTRRDHWQSAAARNERPGSGRRPSRPRPRSKP